MKKLVLAVFVMIAISTGLSAQTKNKNGAPVTPGTNKSNPGYVDANKNNICDNYENNTRQFAGRGQGMGRRGECGMGNRQGCGNRQGMGAGNGRRNS